jgi:CxxC-x17-CxxC domain-containing protein
MTEITFFAKTNFRNQEAKFGIKTDDRRRHVYVIGKTGMGKTNLLEHMAIQDIKNGHGVAYVDPHGDTAEKLIKAIPSSRINDVIYFNPADINFPIAFNVMEKVDPQYRHLVASGLVGVFKKIWADSWGPRLEYILRNAILALLEYPGSTLLGVTRMLVDKNYRIRVVNKLTDPVVRSFWVDEFPKWNERVLQEVVSPIQNKVGQFLSSSLIRNIVGQTRSSFDIRDVMDNKKILILNLSKGRIGEDNSALLGAMMITKIQLAAMGRVDIPEEERKDFYLYVDEFQNFATESFVNILSEARKYRLNLILANQYITQLEETVQNAIFGNAGTLVTFRVGAVDAEFMEKEFEPIFTMNDLVNLPKYHIYLKLMIDGIAGDAFSAVTLPPVSISDTEGNAEKVIRVSRERYASSRAEVEDKISRWSGMAPAEPEEKEKPAAKPASMVTGQSEDRTVKQPEGQLTRQLYDAVCDNCGLKIQVPFRPDGQRPTFCKECLKNYQRAMANSRRQASAPDRFASERSDKNNSRAEISEKRKTPQKTIEPKIYSPRESPLSLSQIQYVAPKKFDSRRKKPELDLKEIRNLIKQSRNGKQL